MSLFGTSPPRAAKQSSSLFDDSALQSKPSASGLFADDPSSSPWDMPTPKKNARRNLVKTLLPSSDVPEAYISVYDIVLARDPTSSASGGSVTLATVRQFLTANSGIGVQDQFKILEMVAGGGAERISREEFNVLLALIGLAQEGEELSLDAVDERRKRLPEPALQGLEEKQQQQQQQQQQPQQREQAASGASQAQSKPQAERTATGQSFGALESDPWGSPGMHRGHAHEAQGYTNGDVPRRTTSAFTTAPGGDAGPTEDFPPTERAPTNEGTGWGGDGGFPTGEDGFGAAAPSNGNGGRPERPTRPLGAGKKTGSSIEEEITISLLEEKEGMFLFQHRNYEVVSTRKNSKVIRRYSDFVWLLDCLHKRYPFRQLPLLPPKRVAINGNHLAGDTTFLEKRRRGLARFANALIRHPVLGQEQLVVMFLTVPTELSVWRKQATISVQEEFTGKSLPASLEDSLPSTLPALFDTIRVGVKRSAEFYIDLCNRVEKLTKYNTGLAGEYMRLSLAMENLAEASQETYAIDTNDVPLLNEGLKSVSKHFDANRALLEDEGRAWDLGALEDFKRQRDCLVSVREMFDRRDRYAKDNIPQLERRIESNENKLSGLRNKPDAKQSDVEKLEDAIIKDKQSIVDQHARGVFIKECIRDELQYFNRSIYHLGRMHQDWSQERVKYSELSADNWRSLADQVEGMPIGEAASRTSFLSFSSLQTVVDDSVKSMPSAKSSKRKLDKSVGHTPDETVTTSIASKKKHKAMPTAYTSAQKTAIYQYVALTTTDKSTAAKHLRQYNWDVHLAANSFFSGGSTVASPHKSKLTKLFDSYRENPKEDPDEVNMEGMGKMMQDMGVDMESADLLVFSELVQSPTLGKMTREGFIDGLSQEGVSDSTKISALITRRSGLLASDHPILKKVYKHTFLIAKAQGSKSIPLDAAIEYWRLLFSPPAFSWSTPSNPWLDWWISFLQEKWKKSVNKDMWDQTLSFAFKTAEDETLAWWSEDSAWPGVIDEFVAWVKEKRGGGEEMDVS